MEYMQLTLEGLQQEEKEIREDLGNIVKGFMRTGWRLSRIDKAYGYRLKGFRTMAEYARESFGLSASMVSRLMEVYEKYSAPGDTPELQEQYRDFNFSQLTEMLQIPEEDRGMVLPEARRDSIRELGKFNRENDGNPDRLLDWAKEPGDNIAEAILEFYRDNEEATDRLFSSKAYVEEGNIGEMVEILNPSGNRSYRRGLVFLMFYGLDKGIMAKEFGRDARKIPWEEFSDITKAAFEGCMDGAHTWKRKFGNAEDGQIPGQDNIMNHPEIVPEEMPEERQQEPEIAPAQQEKTPEQEYEEEQARIDRQTRKKLREREQEEKMAHLPGDSGQQVHQLRLPHGDFDGTASGKIPFRLLKKDKEYRTGDILEMLEFQAGRNTGRLIRAEITYILEDYTGLEDGYCILAFKAEGADGEI